MKEHPEGVFTAGAAPRRDSYVAYAPGFLMQEGDVQPTEESVASGTPAQRILLDRGAGVKGRLMADGEPIAGAPIDFTPGSLYRNEFSPEERLAFQIQSGPDGTFQTTGLRARGKTRLTATRPGSSSQLVVMLDTLESGKIRDLGDLEVLEGGTVLGQVILPEGIDPGGITVYRGDWREDFNQVTDSTGVFRFENVPPGTNSFGQRGRPEILEDGGIVKAIVKPGEVTEVTLDLRDRALVDVEFEIDLGARSPAGLNVSLLVPAPEDQEPRFGIDSRDQIRLGETDEQGVVRARCRAAQDLNVQVSLPHGQRLLHDGEPLSIPFGPPFADRVSFEMSSLVVDLGPDRVLPRDGVLRLDFAKTDGAPFSTHFVRIPLDDGQVPAELDGWAAITGTEVTIHGLEPGVWNVTVYASKKDAPRVETQLPGGRTRFAAKREFELELRATLRAGQTTR